MEGYASSSSWNWNWNDQVIIKEDTHEDKENTSGK
jgi:hypothetical protein